MVSTSRRLDQSAGLDPVLHRSRPHDRMALDEEDVAGEDRPVGRPHRPAHRRRYAAGPTSISSTVLAPTCRVVRPLKVVSGSFASTPAKSKAAEAMREIFARQPQIGRGLHHAGQHGRAFMRHRGGRAFGGDDLRAFDQRIAVAMIAIVMGVEDGADCCASLARANPSSIARVCGIVEHACRPAAPRRHRSQARHSTVPNRRPAASRRRQPLPRSRRPCA